MMCEQKQPVQRIYNVTEATEFFQIVSVCRKEISEQS
jgi:hypothetical protein